MDEPTANGNRRASAGDRRKHPRSGRRTDDPHPRSRWHRVAWLFAAYGVYISLRSVPDTIRRLFRRRVAD